MPEKNRFPAALVPTPFDTTQITSPANYSNPKPGGPCRPLARGAHPPAIAFHCNAQADQLPTQSRDTSTSDPLTRSQSAAVAVACGGIGVYERSDTSATLLKSGQDLGPGCEALVQTQAVAFQQNTRDEVRYINGCGSIAGALAAEAGMKQQNYLLCNMAVRRLTPTECERLQGFPDDHTLIPWRGKPADQCPDVPRYKALGNSMAVPVMRWIGERIQKVYIDSLL